MRRIRSLWAAGMLMRRVRVERGPIFLIALVVAATSCVFASAPRLFDRVSDDAISYAIKVAPAAQRNIDVSMIATIAPGTTPLGGIRDYGSRLDAQIPASVESVVSSRSLRVTTVRLFIPNPPSYETHISLRYEDGLTDVTRITAGRWPVASGTPLKSVPLGSRPPGAPEPPPLVYEIALSQSIADEIGVKLGDKLSVQLDGSDPLLRGSNFTILDVPSSRAQIVPTQLEVVGFFDAIDPNADIWAGDTALLEAEQHGSEDAPIAYVTAYIPAETYADLYASGLPFHIEWRYQVEASQIDPRTVDQLQSGLRRLSLLSGPAAPGQIGPLSVVTGLPAILDHYAAQRDLTQSVLAIGAIGPFGLAAGAIAMLALLLVRRRRANLILARGRGATGALVLGTQLWESLLVTGGAALVGFAVALLVVQARPNPLSLQLSVAVALVAVALLLIASWSTARRSLGQMDRDDPPVLRVPPRRLVIELTIVGVAVMAALLLRQRGLSVAASTGTAGGATTNPQVDPLLASVPVLAGLAAGMLAVRLYPLPVRALGWLAARRRDIVPVLGLRTVSRQPASANLPLLVMLLTAAFGAFSSVIATSLDRGQLAASFLNIGADYRIEKIGINALPTNLDPTTIGGVAAVAPGFVDASAAFVAAQNQRASIDFVAIDPASYDTVTAGTPADPQWPDLFLGDPGGDALGSDANPLPAIVSARLPTGSTDLQPGDVFHVFVIDRQLSFRVVERRATFPGVPGPSFAVVPFNWIQAAFGTRLVSPSVLFIRGPQSIASDLDSAITTAGAYARLVSRYDTFSKLHDAPFSAAIGTGYTLAVIVSLAYMALTIIGAVVLSDARRTRDLAFMRTLGLSGRQALLLTIMEHAPPVLLALVPGVAVGIAVAILCQPGLGLETFVGATGVPLFIDWSALAVMAGALVAVVAVAVGAGTLISSRARVTQALRAGED